MLLSDKRINVIIIVIVVLSIFISYELMKHSPRKNEINNIEVKHVDKIKALNGEIDKNFKNNNGYFTVSLENFDLNDVTISLNINVRKNNNGTYKIDNVMLNNNYVYLNLNQEIIDFNIDVIKENKKNIFIYITTNKGSQDGEGDVVIINNNGNILYQNNNAFIENLDNYKYLVKEKYVDVLINLSCNNNKLDDIAFKNITYKSINGQLVNINYVELKVSDVCYND